MSPLVLATDLDGTFLGGDGIQRRELYDHLERRALEGGLTLIFVTGRDLGFVAELIADPDVPTPHLVIGDVGTTVVHGHDLSPVTPVQSWIDDRWAEADAQVRALLDEAPGLERQAVQGGRRVSYHYDPATLRLETVAAVEAAGFDVLLSADRYLDVLPPGIAKGPTLTRLVAYLGLPTDHVLVAGDTLTDRSLFETPFRGVAVGNSEPALLAAIDGLDGVHRSSLPGCAAITDALQHFGFVDLPAPSSPSDRTSA